MKKIVYISFGFLSFVLKKNLCIDYFLENGIKVDYLDISYLFFKKFNLKNRENKNITIIETYVELEEYIRRNCDKNTLFNVQVHYERRFVKLFRLLKKYDCRKSIFEIGYVPCPKPTNKIIHYLKSPLNLFKRIIDILLTKIYLYFDLINLNYEIRFVAGNYAYNLFKAKNEKIFQINYYDFEEYKKKTVNEFFITSNRYFVFLDIFLYRHEDLSFISHGKYDKEYYKNYLLKLNNFFTYLEEKFSIEVIIAAHPKSNYDSNEFNNRKIIKNNTAILVRNSDAVISHHSTSISYAVLNYKPIFFIYDNVLNTHFFTVYLATKTFAEFLNMPFINIDFEKISSIPIVLESKYQDYKYSFLTTKYSEKLTNKEIIKKCVQYL